MLQRLAKNCAVSEKENSHLKGKNYFDGLTFHRVVKNFIIQGGDPLANGRGGPGYVFGDELPKDENGNLLYTHDDSGILSMAWSENRPLFIKR